MSGPVNLGQVSVPRLLFALLHQRFTGTLTLEQTDPYPGPRTVWIRGGMPVFTDWVAPDEVLGRVLLTQRVIREDQLLAALEAMAAQGGLLGQHLCSQRALDEARLREGLRTQCVRKLTRMFVLRRGTVHATAGGTDEHPPDLRPINVLGLIWGGVSAHYDHARIESEMGPALHTPLRATGALARYCSHFRFRPSDDVSLRALRTGTDLQSLAAITGGGLPRASQLVYTLWACQMLRTAAHSAAAPSAPPTARAASDPPSGTRASLATARSPSAPATTAPAVSTPALDPDESSSPFAVELEALEAKIQAGTHAFELLGVSLDATKREIRRAWSDLSRKFHPDALKRQGHEHERPRVVQVFAALSEAQQVLSNSDQRAKLKDAIEQGEYNDDNSGHDATATARALFQSELLAKEADKLLRNNRFERALARYQEAATFNSDEPDLIAAIIWCEYQLSAKGPNEIGLTLTQLQQVIERSPRLARAHYFLGFVLLAQGHPAASIRAFREAKALDPRLIDAERQARTVEMRTSRPSMAAAPAPEKSKGRLGGLKGLFSGKR